MDKACFLLTYISRIVSCCYTIPHLSFIYFVNHTSEIYVHITICVSKIHV